MTMDKICGHIDCGRYDTDDMLCESCECNLAPELEQRKQIENNPVDDDLNVTLDTSIWYC